MSNLKFKEDSYRGASSITPNDSADLTDAVSAVYVGTTGTLKVDTASGETVTFQSVPVGIFPVAVKKVYSTGTSAANLIGLK